MFNEIEYLPKAIKTAKTALEEITTDYEIIIVDDASSDGSGELSDKFAKGCNKIKVIHHQHNRKLGGVLKTGFSNATKDIIIYTDMDLPFDFKLLRDIVPLIMDCDIVVGSRVGAEESWQRRIYSYVYNHLINFVFQTNIRDINFALKIFKREILNRIELKSEGSFINAEFLTKAKKLGYSIKETKVEYKPRLYGTSRLSSLSVVFKILYEMVKLYLEINSFSRKKVIYKKLREFYKEASFRKKIYNFIRIKTCPFEAIQEFVPQDGTIVDMGCGTGFFLNIISLDNKRRELLGFDVDRRKINVALRSTKGRNNIKFSVADIINKEFNLPLKTKCITLIDVLYYLDFTQKRELLAKCYRALDGEGVIIIKDINKEASLKFLWTFLQEFLAVKVFHITVADGLYFEGRENSVSLLKESGFVVKTFDLNRRYFYPHILYVGKKQ